MFHTRYLFCMLLCLPSAAESYAQRTINLMKEAALSPGDSVVTLRSGWLRISPDLQSEYLGIRVPYQSILTIDSVFARPGRPGRAFRWIHVSHNGIGGWLNQGIADIVRYDAWENLKTWKARQVQEPQISGKDSEMILGERDPGSAAGKKKTETLIYDPASGRYGFTGSGNGESELIELQGQYRIIWELDGEVSSIRLVGDNEGTVIDVARSLKEGIGHTGIEYSGRVRLSVSGRGRWTIGIIKSSATK